MAFVQAEIQSLDLTSRTLQLAGRLHLPFTQLSLDVGAISRPVEADRSSPAGSLIPIKPLEPALSLLESHNGNFPDPFHVVGSGLAGVEVALALRHRWPTSPIHLLARIDRLDRRLAKALREAEVTVDYQPADAEATLLLKPSPQA